MAIAAKLAAAGFGDEETARNAERTSRLQPHSLPIMQMATEAVASLVLRAVRLS
jgi:hypothetical protein